MTRYKSQPRSRLSIKKNQEYEDDSWREGDWEATLQILSNPTNRSEEPSLVEHPTLLLDLEEESTQLHGEADLEVVDADGNCYESIDGVVDVGKAFCSRFPSTSSGKLLNMFSTVDHSKFCIAHLWTYRDLDVVGLADSPTEVRSKNFEISKTKVLEWLTLPVPF